MNSMSNREYHLRLVSSCIFNRVFYSMSLQTRIRYDLGYICFSISRYDKELDALSDKELEDKINSIARPQWDDKYEYIRERSEYLLRMLYHFPTIRMVNILYELLNSRNNMDKEKILEVEHHSALAFSYIHKRIIYPMSLQKRISCDLGYTIIGFNPNDEELYALSDKELMEMTNSLKAPKWNDKYEYIKERNKRLLRMLYFLPSQTLLNILYRILKLKKA